VKALSLFQSGATLILYLLFFLSPWIKAWRRKELGKSYFVGLLFATFFYYGTPIWLLLYGWKTTFLLIAYCIGSVFLAVVVISSVFSIGDSLIVGILVQVPIRVIAGSWLANNHSRLRANKAIA
jgi:hypothetical protein